MQGSEAAGVVGVGDDGGLDAHLAQGGLHRPVEVGRQHDRHAAGGGQPGDGAVRGGGLLEAVLTLLVVRLEVGAQQGLPFVSGAGKRGQEAVVGGRVSEALLVPGMQVDDPGGALGGRRARDEVLLDVPRGRHARGDRSATSSRTAYARGVAHGERELDVRFHNRPPGTTA